MVEPFAGAYMLFGWVVFYVLLVMMMFFLGAGLVNFTLDFVKEVWSEQKSDRLRILVFSLIAGTALAAIAIAAASCFVWLYVDVKQYSWLIFLVAYILCYVSILVLGAALRRKNKTLLNLSLMLGVNLAQPIVFLTAVGVMFYLIKQGK